MLEYHWPGNIRELENLMARSVLLTTSNIITDLIFPSFQRTGTGILPAAETRTMEENERAYILSILVKCNGKLQGAGGAAEMMNMNVSTLRSRMKKLGIAKSKYF
jgi:DNA-binding NtrC family response regulator